jgi:gliding motility-associated-like protein
MKKVLGILSILTLHMTAWSQTEMNWFTDFNICELGDTLIMVPEGDFDDYIPSWFLNGDTISNENSISIISSGSGLYSLELYGPDTLYDQFNVIIDLNNPDFLISLTDSEINIDSIVDICIEDNPTLITQGSVEEYTHFWYLDGLPLAFEPTQSERTLVIEDIIEEIEFNQQYEYQVEIENTCGIHLSKNIVTMFVNECHCALEMPNIFTPNGDEENALFKPINNHEQESEPENICQSTNFSIEIFNQWGRHITSIISDNEYPSWDGRNKAGREVNDGVYFYRIVYQVNIYTEPKEKEITGFVHLYR